MENKATIEKWAINGSQINSEKLSLSVSFAATVKVGNEKMGTQKQVIVILEKEISDTVISEINKSIAEKIKEMGLTL